MHTSLIVAIAVVVGLSASPVPAFLSSAHADGPVLDSKEAMKSTNNSLTDATGKLKTDAAKTRDDAKALDLDKTKKGVGDVKGDAKGIMDSSKGMMTNPMGSK